MSQPRGVYEQMRAYLLEAHPDTRATLMSSDIVTLTGCTRHTASVVIGRLRACGLVASRPYSRRSFKRDLAKFFEDNPFEILSAQDAATKFGVSLRAAQVTLSLLGGEGLVKHETLWSAKEPE